MALTTKQKYTWALGLTILALGIFIWYYFKKSTPPETCPDGSPIPSDGDCTKNYKKDSSGNVIVPPSNAPDKNGCVQPAKYITNSFPLAYGMMGDLVKVLQKKVGANPDGKFGCYTLDKVKKKWNIETVTSQFFIDNVQESSTPDFIQTPPIDDRGCDVNGYNAIGVKCL